MLGTVRWSGNVSLRRGSLSLDLAVWKSTHTSHMHALLKWPLSIPGRILPQKAQSAKVLWWKNRCEEQHRAKMGANEGKGQLMQGPCLVQGFVVLGVRGLCMQRSDWVLEGPLWLHRMSHEGRRGE